MEIRHCPLCGAAYLPGEVSFCVKCGQPLQTKTSIIQDVKRIEQEPNPYNALRIASGFIVFFGWLVIIFGWIFAMMIGSIFMETIASVTGPYSLARNQSYLVSFIIGMISTIQGLFMIAAGQVFLALLDLRNDMHATMRMVRRFGLAMLDSGKPEP